MQLDDNIVRKLGSWRKALRGAGPEDLAWCRALVLLQLHERSFASLKELKEKDTKLKADGWECRALLLELLRMFDGQLELGGIAAKLVNYQSERSANFMHGTARTTYYVRY